MIIRFWEFYKKRGAFLQLILFSVLVVIGIIWMIGQLATFRGAITFFFGSLAGAIATYIYYPEIQLFINSLIDYLVKIQSF